MRFWERTPCIGEVVTECTSQRSQRPSQSPSESAIFLSELLALLPLIMLPLKLLQNQLVDQKKRFMYLGFGGEHINFLSGEAGRLSRGNQILTRAKSYVDHRRQHGHSPQVFLGLLIMDCSYSLGRAQN